MRYGLEVRVPLLDHNLVEQAINISPSIRTKNGEPKYLLKKLLSEFIPSELVYRPKWGFSVPLSKWLNGPLKGKVLEELSSSNVEAVGMFNAKSVEKLLHKFYSGQDYLYNRVWITWNLQRWLQKHSANIV
jgi:asparagine synthase (glutamine-hydrolysing)